MQSRKNFILTSSLAIADLSILNLSFTMGKIFFDSIVKYCKVDEGYASLKSVISKEKMDSMESFYLAETLKYLYLIFTPDETLDLQKYVFNTEAHPFKKLSNQNE